MIMCADFRYIELVFENCNSVRIYPEDIINMSCIDITEHIIINYAKQLVSIKTCRNFTIELKNEALESKTHFEEHFNTTDSGEFFENHVKLYGDLTHVVINQGEKEFNIAVPWESDMNNTTKNIRQKYISLGSTFRIYCGDIDEIDGYRKKE